MEIMHDGNNRRTVLVALDQRGAARDFIELLSADFNVVAADGADDCLRILRERVADLSVAIVDVDMAESDGCALLKEIAEDAKLVTIPVLIAGLRPLSDEDAACFDAGAIDYLSWPYQRGLVKKRIENAIKIKRSTTYYEIESMLRELPSNIFLKDAEGRYVFSTHYWHHLNQGDDPNWTIRGKTDLEIRKDRENAIKAIEIDREILRTGKGATYVIEINADGMQEFMQLIKRPVFDDDGNVTGIIALINDVTEHELLKRELEKRARTDELTGLNNRRSFDECIVELPRRDDFPIAVIAADCDGLKCVNDTYGHLVGDEYIRLSALVFKSALPEGAQAFRAGGDEFVALVPQTTREEANKIKRDMCTKAAMFKLQEGSVSISIGTAVIECADDNPLDAVAHADRSMYESKRNRNAVR
ncbi:MAG: diguanylate cyclase [Eggerthellaceae bacterium]|nr:diguanylate cyclase [Eggerthellaceae bacterium]